MSNQTNIITGADGVTEAEFIVHTKHTCDSCYTRPIVGKRFTSGLVKDFDLCAKCFEGYDEEKKGEFSETVLGECYIILKHVWFLLVIALIHVRFLCLHTQVGIELPRIVSFLS
jgi:hypothetical protein